MVKQRAGYPKGTRSASLHSVEPRPYTPNIEPHNSAFRSKSGSGKRSRDNATFRRNLLGTAFAWQMRSRYAAGEGAQRNFQTAGLNGVFGYFCRRGQKYPAPGRGISLWTIPPSRLRRDTSATLRRTTQCEHWAAFTQGRLDAAALPRYISPSGASRPRNDRIGLSTRSQSLPPPKGGGRLCVVACSTEGRTLRGGKRSRGGNDDRS